MKELLVQSGVHHIEQLQSVLIKVSARATPKHVQATVCLVPEETRATILSNLRAERYAMTEENLTKEYFMPQLLDRVGTHWHVFSIHASIHDVVKTVQLRQAAPKFWRQQLTQHYIAMDFAEPVTKIAGQALTNWQSLLYRPNSRSHNLGMSTLIYKIWCTI